MRQILLIMIGLSISVYADFSRSGDVVTDSKTGLEWQDDTDAGGITKTWQGAIDYCEALNLAGESDWRLPNINELTSLVDDTRYGPAIDTTAFQNVDSYYYWSSTTNAGITKFAHIVDFSSGGQHDGSKGTNFYVRCVRAGQ